MELTTKTKVIGAVIIVLVAFASGRYSVSTKPDVQTVEDKKIDVEKEANLNDHKVTTITQDCVTGSKTTTITEDISFQTKKDVDSTTHVDQTVTQAKRSLINISALASLDTGNGFKPAYGLSANKEFIGPITVGAFGLTNGVLGLSIGVNF